jgi:hypothetical protein
MIRPVFVPTCCGEVRSNVFSSTASLADLTLMFTDVDLDGDMPGRELASTAVQRFPRIDVIGTSGQSVEHVPYNVLLMQKPRLPLELLRQVEMLSQRRTVHRNAI